MNISLRILSLCGASQLLLATTLPAQIMTHGPVVGGVTATEAKVFVRTDQVANVALRYSTDPGLLGFVDTGAMVTAATSDFTATIPLTALLPETTYYLNVLVNGVPQFAAQPFPFFATFPPAGTARDFQFVVLADFGVVAKLTADVRTFASASANLPAFGFIGGDFDHSNPPTLTDKRLMLKNLYHPATRFMSGLVPHILQRMAIARQWDDHDSGLNNLDKNYADWSLTQQAFQEYTPTYPLPLISPGIWQKFNYAQAEFFVLDCRSQRDPASDPEGPNKSMLDGNNLGATGQLEWLKTGLLTSNAVWKVVFTSVVTNPTTKQNDGWGAYQTEWNALRSHITTNNIKNVVFIAGDLHLGAIDNGTQAGFPEMCVAAANSTKTVSCATAATGTWSEGYYDDTCAGYGLVTVLQNPDRLVLQVADQNGVIRVAYTVVAELPTPTPTPTPQGPMILKQPTNASLTAGEAAYFVVKAGGLPPLNYQWKKNGVEIGGATSSSYKTPPTTIADNGALFQVRVGNDGGTVYSNNVTLRVR